MQSLVHQNKNILINGLRENTTSIATLKGGGHYGHTALTISPAEYATIQHSITFLMEAPPGGLTFVAGDIAAGRKDTNYYTTKMSTPLNWNPTSQQHSRTSS